MGIVNLSFFSEMMIFVGLVWIPVWMLVWMLVWIPVRIQGLKCVGAGADCNEAKKSCKFIWDGAEWAADPPEDGCDTKTTQEADTANAACDGAFDKATNICYFHESDTPNQKNLAKHVNSAKNPIVERMLNVSKQIEVVFLLWIQIPMHGKMQNVIKLMMNITLTLTVL